MAEAKRGRPPAGTRARLLEVAGRLFAEKGFAATRVAEITEAAGVNNALLYYYFEDKRSIFIALIQDGVAALSAMLDAALATPGTYSERLRSLVHGHVHLIWQRPNLLRMVQRCQITAEVEGFDLKEHFQEPMCRLVGFFAEAIAAGEFDDVDPHMAALSMLALDSGFSQFRNHPALDLEPDQVADHITRILLRGLLRRPSA